MSHEYTLSESESDEETSDIVGSGKENKRITPDQCHELLSFLNGQIGFKKGKMKPGEETTKLLTEWNDLTLKLNSMGPPIHCTAKWRRVLTRLKSKRKRKQSPAAHPQSQNDKKRTKDEGASSFLDSNPTSCVSLTEDDVSTEYNRNMESSLLLSISKTIDTFVKDQAKVNEDLNKKIDLVIEQQTVADRKNEKLLRVCEVLAGIFGEDINI